MRTERFRETSVWIAEEEEEEEPLRKKRERKARRDVFL